MPQINLAAKISAAKITSNVQSLLQLDGVWTTHLASSVRISAEDIPQLDQLTTEMSSQLRQIVADIPAIQTALKAMSEQTLESQLNALSISQQDKTAVLAKAKAQGGILKAVNNAVDSLKELAPTEQKNLSDKMSMIKGGHFVQGDLSDRCKCVMGWVCVALGAPPVQAAGVVLICACC